MADTNAALTKMLQGMLKMLQHQDANELPADANLGGKRYDSDPLRIDDGGGYPYEDTRPEFVRKDDEGWIRLK